MLFTKGPLPQHRAVQHARLAGTKLDLASTHGNSSTHDVKSSQKKNLKIAQPFKISLWLKGGFGSSLPRGRNIENKPKQ